MPAIDSLLRIVTLRDAEALTMATGQVPSLRRAGQTEPLALPAMDAELVAMFLDEIVGGEERAALAATGGHVIYSSADGVTFAILIERTASGHRLIARRQAAARTSPAPVATGATTAARSTAMATPPPAPSPLKPPSPLPPATPIHLPDPADGDTRTIEDLLALALDRGASDLLLSSDQVPRLRIAGEVSPCEGSEPIGADALLGLLDNAGRTTLAEHGSVDVGLASPSGRVRANVFRHQHGVGAALRLIRRHVPGPRELHLPDDIVDAVRARDGLVLIAGPTGAGKSTTLVALVEHLSRSRGGHIITLEDPIEYEYPPRRGLIHQREIGVHAPSFAAGLRAALREAPDVIVVGELRDRETIAIALTAAETGHLVIATLHAPGAAVAIDRLIDVFPEQQQRQVRLQLAAVVRVIVTQYLVPARRGGRVPAIERVIATAAVANLIRKGELQMLGSHVQAGRDAGMIPLERSLARLVRDGIVELAAARACAPEPDALEQALRVG